MCSHVHIIIHRYVHVLIIYILYNMTIRPRPLILPHVVSSAVLERSEELPQHYSDMEILLHPGGHGIPMSSAQKKAFNKFLLECKELCVNQAEAVTVVE